MTETRDENVAADGRTFEDRTRSGEAWFEYVTTKPITALNTPFFDVGVRDFVFGELWSRPGLDTRTRRWISLACAAASGVSVPVQSHIYSALKSGHITCEELHEFTLHFAVYCGWPKASILDQMITQTWERIQEEGGVATQPEPGAAE
jgi:4-carboxymuconolactone decarboxylase